MEAVKVVQPDGTRAVRSEAQTSGLQYHRYPRFYSLFSGCCFVVFLRWMFLPFAPQLLLYCYTVKPLHAERVIIISALITLYSHWLNEHTFTWPQCCQGLEEGGGRKGHLAGEAELLVVAVHVVDDYRHHPSQSVLPGAVEVGLLCHHLNDDLADQLTEQEKREISAVHQAEGSCHD